MQWEVQPWDRMRGQAQERKQAMGWDEDGTGCITGWEVMGWDMENNRQDDTNTGWEVAGWDVGYRMGYREQNGMGCMIQDVMWGQAWDWIITGRDVTGWDIENTRQDVSQDGKLGDRIPQWDSRSWDRIEQNGMGCMIQDGMWGQVWDGMPKSQNGKYHGMGYREHKTGCNMGREATGQDTANMMGWDVWDNHGMGCNQRDRI
ncbi:hypothetical protein L208DRAFT_1380230 [Tricholoma matsutake]|nr:hypothetical protein L208DRAFT_1380230 [Tricholoma matsutake 945]